MNERPSRIVMATGNPGKLREIARLLDALDIEVVAQSALGVSDADETGSTFAENSLIKARHAAELTGLPAIADDSGLCVDALDGEPGVRSARFAGTHGDDAGNNRKLLEQLQGVEQARRRIPVRCDVRRSRRNAVGGTRRVARRNPAAPRGDGGFGYDPLFYVPELDLSSAELDADEKNARSHRGQALRQLVGLIEQRYA